MYEALPLFRKEVLPTFTLEILPPVPVADTVNVIDLMFPSFFMEEFESFNPDALIFFRRIC